VGATGIFRRVYLRRQKPGCFPGATNRVAKLGLENFSVTFFDVPAPIF